MPNLRHPEPEWSEGEGSHQPCELCRAEHCEGISPTIRTHVGSFPSQSSGQDDGTRESIVERSAMDRRRRRIPAKLIILMFTLAQSVAAGTPSNLNLLHRGVEIPIEPRLRTPGTDWTVRPAYPLKPGMAGLISGAHNGVLIAAGGANFPERMPWEGGVKVYYDEIFV